MKRKDRKLGFTMAEMLIVVAIIGVLGAVAFVAVNQHQRSLERLERDSVAREIFVAAQNHLTMAKGQGYLGVDETGYGNVEDANIGYYFFVVNQGDAFGASANPSNLLDLMLPFGAIDETVRGGGSYIIRYHPESATVMDVFYCSNPFTDTRYGYNLSSGEEKKLVDEWREGKESDRRNYEGKVLGWYGGAEGKSLKPSVTLEAPLLYVENSDKLRVGVVNKNTSGSLQIIVTGMTSNTQIVFNLKSSETDTTLEEDRLDKDNKTVDDVACDYAIILDDITTANMHFADLTVTKADGTVQRFFPGEDVKIQAIAFDNTQISNIGYSAEITVNSLYEKLEMGATNAQSIAPMTATVSSIRHLENLDRRISGFNDSNFEVSGDSEATPKLNQAIQNSDLSWTAFKGNTNGVSTVIQLYGASAGTTETGCFLPVVPTNDLAYDGDHHSVSDIKVNYAGNAGMFGSITGVVEGENYTEIKDLALIDFEITQTDNGNAGTLAGTLNTVKVENVIAYNSDTTKGVLAKSGHAGGLIGSATNCDIEKSAASLYVTSDKGHAGGLIGETSAGSVSGCYSGGHTHDGTYYKTIDDGTKTADFNVTATAGNAGGLIGLASSTPIDYSYSTCSAIGETVGGLVGSSNGEIQHSYCTGLVKSTATTPAEGAFVGAWSGSNRTEDDGNYYLDIINEREIKEDGNLIGYDYLPPYPVSGSNSPVGITAIDETAGSYNDFSGAEKDNGENYLWKLASAYDAKLIEYYHGRYNLKTVEQLGASITRNSGEEGDGAITDFVATHYGDWPAPELFVVNAPTP